MIDGVLDDTPPPIIRIASVAIDVKVWEIAATNIDTNPVVHRKQVGGWLKKLLCVQESTRRY